MIKVASMTKKLNVVWGNARKQYVLWSESSNLNIARIPDLWL